MEMGDIFFLKLPLPALPLYNQVKESISKSDQNQLFQFIARDIKCPIVYTMLPIHCRLEKSIEYAKKQYNIQWQLVTGLQWQMY